MRAVHIEAVFGYITSNFLMALRRFASLHGWPEKIYSEPGSQLVGAERELKEAWPRINRECLQRDSAQNGSTWVFGPANSPWHQGAVESLIHAADLDTLYPFFPNLEIQDGNYHCGCPCQ